MCQAGSGALSCADLPWGEGLAVPEPWERRSPGSVLDPSSPVAGERHAVPLSPHVLSLPAGAASGRDLCFDQAAVFIEDAIQVGGTCPLWLGLGPSPGFAGTG